jgi:hypothetical protein
MTAFGEYVCAVPSRPFGQPTGEADGGALEFEIIVLRDKGWGTRITP